MKRLTAYNTRTKEKKVEMYNVIINKTSNGTLLIAQGTTKDGKHNLTSVVSIHTAVEAVRNGLAEFDNITSSMFDFKYNGIQIVNLDENEI